MAQFILHVSALFAAKMFKQFAGVEKARITVSILVLLKSKKVKV